MPAVTRRTRATTRVAARALPIGFIASAGSFGISLVLGEIVFGWYLSLLFCAVVLAHELGHWALARLARTAIGGPLVIFPLGGLTFSRPALGKRRQRAQATVFAAGPIAGALFATVAGCLWWMTGIQWLLLFAQFSIWLNLLNLLPVGVLDGGRLARLAGVPTVIGALASAPVLIQHWWLALPLALAPLSDSVIKPPDDKHERRRVRRIAFGGGLLAAGWLLALGALLPPSPW